jgi:hypothetical protein
MDDKKICPLISDSTHLVNCMDSCAFKSENHCLCALYMQAVVSKTIGYGREHTVEFQDS